MNCPQCGRENPDTALYCGGCGAGIGKEVPAASPQAPSLPPKTSGLAVASLIFGILGLLCLLPIIGSIVGLVLGIMALVAINRSQGQLGGIGLAIAGLITSGFGFFVAPIIAAIVLPVFLGAREKARQTTCISNVKQLSLGAMMYIADHDEVFPLKANWADGLTPYIRKEDLFRCPNAPDDQTRCYAYNAALSGRSGPDVFSPPTTAMLFDTRLRGVNPAGGPDDVDPRHRGGSVFGYADGHVRWLPQSAFRTQVLWQPSGTPSGFPPPPPSPSWP